MPLFGTVLSLMEGSNDSGAAASDQLEAPHYEKHDRTGIRVRSGHTYDGSNGGYRAGLEHPGGSGAPDFLTVNMYHEDRREFRRGYHDGFERGKFDRKHGVPPGVARPY
jgi:hypothetical protein